MKGNFGRATAEQINPQIEAELRQELGLSGLLPYKIEDQRAGRSDRNMFMHDLVNFYFTSSSNALYRLYFQPQQPRPTEVQVQIIKWGAGTFLGNLLYVAPLACSLSAAVTLDQAGRGDAPFTGEQAAAGRLNADKLLLQRANRFARISANYGGGVTFKAPRLFQIVPATNGSLLIGGTFPRVTSMWSGSVTLDAAEYVALAQIIEASLRSLLRAWRSYGAFHILAKT